jgi:DeoR family fructose operon transcriptional repressor
VDSAEASLNKRMLTRSAHRFVLADSSKFGTMATYKVAPLNAAKVITDAGLSHHWRGELANLGVETTIADPGGKE